MEYTKNLRLSKPSYDDDVDVQVLNNNMDLLDEKVGNLPYLPLRGGKMQGNISLPFDIGLTYDGNHFLNFQQTNFKNVTKNTIAIKGDRLKYYSPSGKELVAEDSGLWWNGDLCVQDIWTQLNDFGGYTKLSTGLLLQWGRISTTSQIGSVVQVTFPTPMKDNKYIVQVAKTNSTDGAPPNLGGDWWSVTFSQTNTNFKMACDSSSNVGKWYTWIAIGRA